VNLAFSLHSPFEEKRNRLVPINKTHPFPQVLETLDEHIRVTGRKIFVAYLVLDGHNDSEAHAKAVAELLTAKRQKDVRHLY
jgi:23S rRNA (adenine-C8)-methyltransferase